MLCIAYLIFGSISPKANESFYACIRLEINPSVIDSLKQYENRIVFDGFKTVFFHSTMCVFLLQVLTVYN